MPSISFQGDSITQGAKSTGGTNKWTTKVCSVLGYTESNSGVASSTLEYRTPYRPMGAASMIERPNNIPYKTDDLKYLMFMYGMNDYGINQPNYNTDAFIQDYSSIIRTAIEKGWHHRQIVIISPSYPTDASFTFYSNLNGGNPPTRARIEAFVAAAQSAAAQNRVNFIDVYSPMAADGSIVSKMDADGVHPIDAGHLIIANTVISYLQQLKAYNMTYPLMGTYPIVPAADLISLTSMANKKGDARKSTENSGNALGKRAGTLVMRDSGTPGATQYQLCFARGSLPADLWSVVDGSASYTPV